LKAAHPPNNAKTQRRKGAKGFSFGLNRPRR
jgi:hypothetical protein